MRSRVIVVAYTNSAKPPANDATDVPFADTVFLRRSCARRLNYDGSDAGRFIQYDQHVTRVKPWKRDPFRGEKCLERRCASKTVESASNLTWLYLSYFRTIVGTVCSARFVSHVG